MSPYLVNAKNQAESTEQSRIPPPRNARVEFCSVGSPQADRVFEWDLKQPIVSDDPWHHIDQLCICALTSASVFAATTCWARQCVCSSKSLNILTAHEPMGLSSCGRLLLLASHCMVLTREHKNPSWIAREIKIFSIFLWLVHTLILKHNLRFLAFRRTICWSWWLINIYETFGRKKITIYMWNFVSVPCSETGPNLRTSLFVGCWL